MASDHQIESLVKLLFATSLFSRESEKMWAISYVQLNNPDLTKEDCDTVVRLGNEIHPNRLNNRNMYDQKMSELQHCIEVAKQWIRTGFNLNKLENLLSDDYLRSVRSVTKESQRKESEYDFSTSKNLIFWDHQNNEIPEGACASELHTNIKKGLQSIGRHGDCDFRAYGLVELFPNGLDGSIHHIQCDSYGNATDTADKYMIMDMIKYAARHMETYNEPTTIVAITSDVDFFGVIQYLSVKHNFYLILAHGDDNASLRIKSAPDRCVRWVELARSGRMRK